MYVRSFSQRCGASVFRSLLSLLAAITCLCFTGVHPAAAQTNWVSTSNLRKVGDSYLVDIAVNYAYKSSYTNVQTDPYLELTATLAGTRSSETLYGPLGIRFTRFEGPTSGWGAGTFTFTQTATLHFSDSAGRMGSTVPLEITGELWSRSGPTFTRLAFTFFLNPKSLSFSVTLPYPPSPPNTAPAASGDGYQMFQSSILTMPASGVLGNDRDADGDGLTAVKISNPSNGTVTLNADGSFIYGPNPGFTGTDFFIYQASDGKTLSNTATVAVTVAPSAMNLVFVSNRDGNPEIYAMRRDGTGQTRLTYHPARDFSPAVSPTGNGIAFISNRDGSFQLYLMNPDGSNVRRLTYSDVEEGDPSFSPDGTKIAFARLVMNDWELFVLDLRTLRETRLTVGAEHDYAPVWSPDGNRIAFSSRRTLNYEVHVLDLRNGSVARLTSHPADDGVSNGCWSPDGSQILFTSNRSGKWQIYAMNVDGSNPTRLSDGSTSDYNPCWSPDGRKIAFTTNRHNGGDYDIYVMNADGSSPTRLTLHPAPDGAPAWSPR